MTMPPKASVRFAAIASAFLIACHAQAGSAPALMGAGVDVGSAGFYVPPASIPVIRNISYGSAAKEAFDVYLPASRSAPKGVIVMVHGGAWAKGDKTDSNVVANKAAYFTPLGYALVSVNYDLIPSAYPVAQAAEVAKAIAKAQSLAAGWGAPAGKLILMGHSAGANLVSQLTANPALAYAQGAAPWSGTVSLDSAAQDVPEIMALPHMPLYDTAFGSDHAYWIQASPTLNVVPGGPPILMVCSAQRLESCPQAKAYLAASAAKRRAGSLLTENLSHSQINVDVGLPGAYTAAIQAFISSSM